MNPSSRVTVVNEDNVLTTITCYSQKHGYIEVIGVKSQATEKGFIAVAILKKSDGSYAVMNYHPLRKGFQEVYLTRPDNIEQTLVASMASLKRLLEIL